MKLLPITKNNKTGFIDSNGTIIIEPEYEHKYFPGIGSCLIQNSKMYFINENNNLIEFEDYLIAGQFSCGLCEISRNNKKGYIDNYGKIVIEPKYYETNKYHNGYAVVRDSMTSNAKFIDTNGNCLLEDFWFSITTKYCDGIINHCFLSNQEMHAGFINLKKEWVIEPIYEHVYQFSEGLAAVQNRKTKKYGYINRQNQLVLKYDYDGIMIYFKEGFSCVCDNDGFYYGNL